MIQFLSSSVLLAFGLIACLVTSKYKLWGFYKMWIWLFWWNLYLTFIYIYLYTVLRYRNKTKKKKIGIFSQKKEEDRNNTRLESIFLSVANLLDGTFHWHCQSYDNEHFTWSYIANIEILFCKTFWIIEMYWYSTNGSSKFIHVIDTRKITSK